MLLQLGRLLAQLLLTWQNGSDVDGGTGLGRRRWLAPSGRRLFFLLLQRWQIGLDVGDGTGLGRRLPARAPLAPAGLLS